MQPSILYLSEEYKINLWIDDPRFIEYTYIEEEAQEACRTCDFTADAYKRFSDWNPLLQNSDRDFSALQQHFHPAIVKDQKLFRINDVGLDIFNTAFTCSPQIEEELHNIHLVDSFITFHRNGYPLFFKPSIQEVLSQLPQKMSESHGDFYFTTETIAKEVNQCTVGNNGQYHVAVTSVYLRV